MVDESVTVKGSPARSLQKFIDTELTAEQRELLFRGLPVEYATRFRSPILATEVLPVHMLNRLTEEAAKVKGEAPEQFARRLGRQAASDAIRGIYRFFALVLTPTALLARGSNMWSSLYSRGAMSIHEETRNGATIRLVNFPSEAIGCARIAGWMESLAEATGVKGVRVEQTQCVTKGAMCCEWKVQWR